MLPSNEVLIKEHRSDGTVNKATCSLVYTTSLYVWRHVLIVGLNCCTRGPIWVHVHARTDMGSLERADSFSGPIVLNHEPYWPG